MNKKLFLFLFICLFFPNLYAEKITIGKDTTYEKKGNQYFIQMGKNKPLTITLLPNSDGTIKYEY